MSNITLDTMPFPADPSSPNGGLERWTGNEYPLVEIALPHILSDRSLFETEGTPHRNSPDRLAADMALGRTTRRGNSPAERQAALDALYTCRAITGLVLSRSDTFVSEQFTDKLQRTHGDLRELSHYYLSRYRRPKLADLVEQGREAIGAPPMMRHVFTLVAGLLLAHVEMEQLQGIEPAEHARRFQTVLEQDTEDTLLGRVITKWAVQSEA